MSVPVLLNVGSQFFVFGGSVLWVAFTFSSETHGINVEKKQRGVDMNVFARRNGVSFRDPADKYSVDENYAVTAAEHSSTDTETEEEGKAVAMEDSAYTYSTTSILRR